MVGVSLLIEYRYQRCVLQQIAKNRLPFGNAGVLLASPDNHIGLCRSRVELFFAVFRPVPASFDSAATAQDAIIEVRWIGEIGDPSHATRPDHRRIPGA